MIHSSGKRRRYKRYLSVFIAFVMVCSVFIPAFAKSAGNGTDGDEATKASAAITYEFYSDGELYDSQTVKDGETLKEPSEPDKDGSTFEGWYTSGDGGSKFTDFSKQSVTESKTVKLYARWQEMEKPETESVEDNTDKGTSGNDTENSEEVSEEADSGKKEDASEETGSDIKEEDSEEQTESGQADDVSDEIKDGSGETDSEDSSKTEEVSDKEDISKQDEKEFSSDVSQSDEISEDSDKIKDEDTEKVETEDDTIVDSADTSDDMEKNEGNTAVIQPQQELGNGISPLNINGPREVSVGETITLSGQYGSNHFWSAYPSSRVSLNQDGNSVDVTGVTEGTVWITHTYRSWGGQQTETYTIQVTAASSGQSYVLYTYTLIPGKTTESTGSADQIWNGMGIGNISGLGSPDSHNTNEVLDNGYGSNGADITYPSNYPPITVDGTSYKYADTPEKETQEGYYTITWFRVVVDYGANAGSNGHNPVVSENTKTFHLDGYITLNEINQYTVDFKLKDAGEQTFEPVDPVKYTRRVDEGYAANQLSRPDQAEPEIYSETKTVNGILYTFDGWYKDEACTEKVDWDSEIINANTTYYAQYVPVGKDITITKDVTGGLGDVMKDFSFTYNYSGGDGTFALKDGGTYTIKNVPVGTTLTLTETNAGGYTTSANYGDENIAAQENKESETKTIRITVNSTSDKITITNNKEAIVDVGIRMDNLPYILMLALVAGGAAVAVILRRRRS